MRDSKRLFIAVPIAPDVRRELAQLPRSIFPPMRWVAPNQYHITLKFLGDVPESQVNPVKEAAGKAVANHGATFSRGIAMIARGIGSFPSNQRARILWAGLTGDTDTLHKLQHSVENELATQGFPKEIRPFKPHITLARSRQERALGDRVEQYEAHNFGSWTIDRLDVIESQLLPTGPHYITLHTVPLGSSLDSP